MSKKKKILTKNKNKNKYRNTYDKIIKPRNYTLKNKI